MITRLAFAAFLFLSAANSAEDGSSSTCERIQLVLANQSDACRCYDNGERSSLVSWDEEDHQLLKGSKYPWIGCSRERMPAIFRSLNALDGDTIVDKLWIWDSLMPLVPVKLFAKLRVRKLVLENDHLGEFAPGVLAPLAPQLKQLIVKNNIIKDLDGAAFTGLVQLRLLDLSGNRIDALNATSFGVDLISLIDLSLYNNEITTLTDFAFGALPNLRSLNLASNHLERLPVGVFANLHKLERLTLEDNRLVAIDDGVFAPLSNLKVLNLGANFLRALRLPITLNHVTQLLLHNNSFDDARQLRIEAPQTLRVLNMDTNSLTVLDDGQFRGFVGLEVLSLASNQLTTLRDQCLTDLSNLAVLSLQNNQIGDDLSPSVFGNAPNLHKLFMSQNQLTKISSNLLAKSPQLKVFSAAHNRISQMEPGAFDGLRFLEKLYLNDNQLQHLPNSTFDDVSSSLYAIDLSDNKWECDCQSLWLVKWLSTRSEFVVDFDANFCKDGRRLGEVLETLEIACNWRVAAKIEATFVETSSTQNGLVDVDFWLTCLGIVMGVVSVLILLGVVLLYLQDNVSWSAKLTRRRQELLRRVPSDMVNLIGSNCSTSSLGTKI